MRRHHTSLQLKRQRRGLSLVDALVGMGLMAFGMLALAGFQTRMVAQNTDAQIRAVAMQFANELLNTALVDPDNLACYSLPAAGACASVVARDGTDAWGQRVGAALPGPVAVTSTQAGTQLTVLIGWAGRDGAQPRTLTVVTDVQ
jgi:type IV pilus assembly protein PilV